MSQRFGPLGKAASEIIDECDADVTGSLRFDKTIPRELAVAVEEWTDRALDLETQLLASLHKPITETVIHDEITGRKQIVVEHDPGQNTVGITLRLLKQLYEQSGAIVILKART